MKVTRHCTKSLIGIIFYNPQNNPSNRNNYFHVIDDTESHMCVLMDKSSTLQLGV